MNSIYYFNENTGDSVSNYKSQKFNVHLLPIISKHLYSIWNVLGQWVLWQWET